MEDWSYKTSQYCEFCAFRAMQLRLLTDTMSAISMSATMPINMSYIYVIDNIGTLSIVLEPVSVLAVAKRHVNKLKN